MILFLILSHFTILVECEKLSRLIKSQNVYMPMEHSSAVRHDDDDDPPPDEDMTTVGIRDYINDDLDDDPLHNRSKARKYGDPDDENYVNLPYRPTKRMDVINSSGNFLIGPNSNIIGPNLQLLQNEVPYSEEPWPTITLSTFDVIVPMIPTWPTTTSPPTWRSYFPPLKTTSNQDEQKRNISRDAMNFTTERASKFDVGILDRFIYPEDYILSTQQPDEEAENTGIPTFLSRSTVTMVSRPTLTWFSRPKSKNKMRVVVKFTNTTYKTTPSRTAAKRFSVHFRKEKKTRAALRQLRKEHKWLCYDCGLNETTLSTPACHKIFQSSDGRFRGKRVEYMKLCTGDSKLYGSCFTRYLDVGATFEERGCREIPPVMGKSYASKRLARLENLLKHDLNGCVNSPYAILTPFSRAVYLYARFHVCVCKGKLCNASLWVTPEPLGVVACLLCYSIIKETWVLS